MRELSIGLKLKKIREANRKTQVEFAELLGVSPASYQRIERGETGLDVEELLRFAEILSIPIMDFLEDRITFNQLNENGSGVINNACNYHSSQSESELALSIENKFLKEKIGYLEAHIKRLEENYETLAQLYDKANEK